MSHSQTPSNAVENPTDKSPNHSKEWASPHSGPAIGVPYSLLVASYNLLVSAWAASLFCPERSMKEIDEVVVFQWSDYSFY